MIPLDEIKERGVYRVLSRNLDVAVFDGKDGFIGIRRKFDSDFLDTEIHRDAGGTCTPLELIGTLPDEIDAKERWPSYDTITGRPTAFDRPVASGGKGWYYADTGEPDQNIRSVSPQNQLLFDYLESLR